MLIWEEVRDLAIKEMPLEEKYDKLYNDFLLTTAMYYAYLKEMGVDEDKLWDYFVKVQRKILPSYLGPTFKLLKKLAPGRTFKQLVDHTLYTDQAYNPLSNFEVTRASDREVVGRTKNCEVIRRLGKLVKKTGLDIDPRFWCRQEAKINIELAKEFGLDLTLQLEEDGCIVTAKLK
jgi:hypothetical protein